jgi:spermidine synthase
MPFHLATREFFELAQKKLTPNGIVVANLISAVTGPSGKIARAFVKTQRRIFPQITFLPPASGQRQRGDDTKRDSSHQRQTRLTSGESAPPLDEPSDLSNIGVLLRRRFIRPRRRC